jgi:hypothetical protein
MGRKTYNNDGEIANDCWHIQVYFVIIHSWSVSKLGINESDIEQYNPKKEPNNFSIPFLGRIFGVTQFAAFYP